MRKNLVITISFLLLTLGIPIQTYADSANPPKITNVIELSKGSPYKPGDVVSYKVEHTGGNPGVASIGTNFDRSDKTCESWISVLRPMAFAVIKPLIINEYQGNGVISFVIPNCYPGKYWVEIIITDLTRLEDKTQRIPFEIIDVPFKPIPKGEMTPSPLLADKLDLSIIPKSPKVGDVFQLPKYTHTGVPVYYTGKETLEAGETLADRVCYVYEPYDRVTRPGGVIKFNKSGVCNLGVISDTGIFPRFGQPLITSTVSVKQYSNNKQVTSSGLAFNVGSLTGSKSKIDKVEAKTTITCIKGKTTKKVFGTNPKCPKGYKVKA